MMKVVGSLAALLGMVSVAHADDAADDWSGVGTGIAVLGAIEATPLVMLAVDGVARPSSTTYGAVEIGAGTLGALVNTGLAIDLLQGPCDGCDAVAPWFVGFAVLDVVSALHGGYVIAHHGKHESAVLTPTVVHQGKTAMPGLALGGSF